MKNKARIWITFAVVFSLLAFVSSIGVWLIPLPAESPIFARPQGVSNFDSIHLADTGGTATPIFIADQIGLGVIAEFRDASTPVARMADGGGLDMLDNPISNISTLDIDGNISSTTGAITITDNVQITGTVDADGAVTLNSTLDIDGNISSGTGAITITDNVQITGTVDADGAVTLNSTLDIDGNISSGTGAVTVTDSLNVTGTVDFDSTLNIDSTLTLESIAFSGPVRFGTASSVVSGTTIAHSVGTTPTVVLLMPQGRTAYTATVYVLATDTVSITIGIETGDGLTISTLNWLAGK